MIKTYSLTALKSSALFVISTEFAHAVETTDSSSISIWPLIGFVVLLIIFRKKIVGEATPEIHEPDHHESEHHEVAEQKPEEVVEPEAPAPQKATTAKKPTQKKGNVDLKDGSEQCQASTTKGTRCKRTTTLEDASVTIDGTTYNLTVCKQHNNDVIKPFADFIK